MPEYEVTMEWSKAPKSAGVYTKRDSLRKTQNLTGGQGRNPGNGQPRIRDHQGSTKEVQETEPGKRMREKSPEAETLRWRTRPTFLAVRGKKTGEENQTHDETQGKQSGKTN